MNIIIRIAEHAHKIFIDENVVNGLIVGGPGPTKENFLKEEYLDYRLQKNVISYNRLFLLWSEGIRELLEKVNEQDIITEYRLLEEKKLVKRFMSQVHSVGDSVYMVLLMLLAFLKMG